MDVQLPDGRIITGVPEGTTKAQIAAKLGIVEEKTLGQDIAGDFQNRMQNVQELKHGGNVDPLMTGLYATGQALGFGGDVAFQGAKAITPEFIKKPIGQAAGYVAEKSAPIVKPLAERYGQFKQENPNVAAGLETAGNYAGFGLGTKGAKLAARPIEKTIMSKPVQSFIKDTGHRPIKPKDITVIKADEYNQKFAKPLFEQVNRSGTKLSKDATAQSLYSARQGLGRDPKIAPDPADRLIEDMINGSSKSESWLGSETSLQTLQKQDVKLNDLKNQAWEAGDNDLARKYSIIQRSLRELRDNPQPGAIIGEPDAINAWKQANHHFNIKSDISILEAAEKFSKYKAQPANSLATRAAKLLEDETGWRPEEIAILEKIAESKLGDEMLRAGGSRLTQHGAGLAGIGTGALLGGVPGAIIGGVAGEVAGVATSAAARASAWKNKMKLVDELKRTIMNRKPPETISKPELLQIGDRGQAFRDAERAASRKADVSRRMEEGRTGGKIKSVKKGDAPPIVQSGPYVGRPDGDVPYNYYNPPPTAEGAAPKLLMAPQKEFVAYSNGVIREQAAKELSDATANRELYKNLGLSSDVLKENFKRNMREKFADIWDTIDLKSQAQINKQIEDAWKSHKKSIDKIIIEQSVKRRGLEKPKTGMEQAMKNATRGKK